MNNTVLFEIGVEELPARFIDDAEDHLRSKTSDWLTKERILFQEIVSFATPRRLAILIKGIATKQETIVEKVRGPKLEIAKDEVGNWTKAAIGFAKGQGKEPNDIFVEEIKGIPYIFVEKRIEGINTIDRLAEFGEIIQSIPFPQTMRWGTGAFRFARPIRWLVALMNDQVISLEVAGIKADRITYGHRFLGKEITLTNPEQYEQQLQNNFVIANANLREEIIVKQIKELETQENFSVNIDASLLNEVRHLVEFPTVFYGTFEEQYLTLPEEVLITSMQEHQRYFPVFDKEKQRLLPYFVSVRNGNNDHIENVIKGNEKVLRARLADARFFFEEDKKHSINFYMDKLKTVIFQEKIGTMYEKTIRVRELTEKICDLLNVSAEVKENALRAASICKFDLVTDMVNEFTELQGIMGEKYALHFGENKEVALAIKEHYYPLQSTGELPTSIVGSIVSVADKLDTVIGTLSVGLIPTGSQDPYGLRRQTLGLLRIILQNKWDICVEQLINLAKQLFTSSQYETEYTRFFTDRVTFLLHAENIEQDVIRATLAQGINVFNDTFIKAKLLSEKRNDDTFTPSQQAFVRVLNLYKHKTDSEVDTTLFQTESERNLYDVYLQVKKQYKLFADEVRYEEALQHLEKLANPIHEFFEHNMVMDPNEKIKQNRLAIIQEIAELLLQFANFSLVEWNQQL